MGPTTNFLVQNTTFHDKSAIPLHLGLAEIKTLHPRDKIVRQDAGCAGKKNLCIGKLELPCVNRT